MTTTYPADLRILKSTAFGEIKLLLLGEKWKGLEEMEVLCTPVFL